MHQILLSANILFVGWFLFVKFVETVLGSENILLVVNIDTWFLGIVLGVVHTCLPDGYLDRGYSSVDICPLHETTSSISPTHPVGTTVFCNHFAFFADIGPV